MDNSEIGYNLQKMFGGITARFNAKPSEKLYKGRRPGSDYCYQCREVTPAYWKRRLNIFGGMIFIALFTGILWVIAACFVINPALGVASMVGTYYLLYSVKDKSCSKCRKFYDNYHNYLNREG